MYCALVVVGITVSCERPKLQHTNPLIRLTLHPPAHPEVHCFIPWSISSPCSGQFEVQCSGCLWMTQESWKRGNCSCFLLAQRPCRLPRRPLLCSPALSQGLWELSGVSSTVYLRVTASAWLWRSVWEIMLWCIFFILLLFTIGKIFHRPVWPQGILKNYKNKSSATLSGLLHEHTGIFSTYTF